MNYEGIIFAIESTLNCILTDEQCENLAKVIDEYIQKDEALRSRLEELDDEEERIERQRQHWQERAAIERDYIQLY
jgi:predicted  nucleic acid-binding Zn-ribbon protein